MNTFLKISALSALLVGGMSSIAYADCGTTAYTSFQTSYPYQVTDTEGSTKPVAQTGLTESCGHWWFDAFGSKDLTGTRTFGNEVDLTAAYDGALGQFHYEALASWWLLPHFDHLQDDILQLQLDVSRPFAWNVVTVAPYVRATHLQSFGAYRNAEVGKVGLRVSLPFRTHWSLSADAGVAKNFANGVTAKRLNASASYAFGSGWSVNAGVKLADHLKPAYVIGVTKHF
jgi:hypothetical protein